MNPEEFAKVREGMDQDVFGKPPKKAKQEKKIKKEPESDDDKRKKEAIAAKATAARKFKNTYEKVRKDVNEATVMLPKLKEKGFPVQMQEHMANKLNDIKKMADEAAEYYGAAIIKAESSDVTEIKNEAEEYDTRAKALEERLTDEKKKGTIFDLKKMT